MKDLFGYETPAQPYRGDPPYQQHSPTSEAAAKSIKQRIGPLHKKVLDELTRTGGLTDEEMMNRLGLGGNTLRPRRRELELMGRIQNSGKSRLTQSGRSAVIWERVA